MVVRVTVPNQRQERLKFDSQDAVVKAGSASLITSTTMPGSYTHKFDTPAYRGEITLNTG